MPRVTRRWVYAAAALLLAASFLGLSRATGDVAHVLIELEGGVPVVVYEPGPQRLFGAPPELEERLPVVLLGHGFSGNKAMMSTLARRLARAGYAVVAFDFQGHGQSKKRFAMDTGGGRLLSSDIDAALLYATTQPHLDPERIVLAGHSMGGFTALDYASRNAGLNAVVAISAGAITRGPYTPPNTLLIFASGDPQFLREGVREAGAHFAGLDRVVLERTYGDPLRGTALRVEEVEGVDHLTILYSDEAARRIVSWLVETIGAGADPVEGGDGRLPFVLLGLVAFLVLFAALVDALAPHVPRVELPATGPIRGLIVLTAGLVGAALLLSGVDNLLPPGPFGFVPLVIGGPLLGFFLVAGLLALAFSRAGAAHSAGLLRVRTFGCAVVLLAFSYLVVGTLGQPFSDLFLSPARFFWALVGSALALPFFGAAEWLLRGPGPSGVWAPIVGRVLTLVVIGVAAFLGLVPYVLLLGLGAFVFAFALLEITGWILSRRAPNPWLCAVFQSGFTAWLLAATSPLAG
jgi:pimeloyl-ACP methyl ester carboxylesterase